MREGGKYIVRCADRSCFDWIQGLVGEHFLPWEGANLTTCLPSQVVPLTRCRIWVPNRFLSLGEAMECLQGLNQSLFTHRWKTEGEERSTVAGNGYAFTVFVDKDSLEVIKGKKGELYYPTGKAYVSNYPGWTNDLRAKTPNRAHKVGTESHKRQ